MYHCCGNVNELMERFIDLGIDISDPIQVSSDGMDLENVAAKYKGRIMFHGAVSSQMTFTHGTPEDVYRETQDAIRILGPCGYIPAPDHYLIGSVTAEKVEAFVRAVKEYKL